MEQRRSHDQRQRSLPHALPSRAAPAAIGPVRGSGARRRPAGLAHAVAHSILLLPPSISPSPARADSGEEGSERKRDGGTRARGGQLGGHIGDEVRTESWAAVEAGCCVWARGVVRHVGGARRASRRRRRELGGELAGGGGGRDNVGTEEIRMEVRGSSVSD